MPDRGTLERIDQFVAGTRDALFVRRADSLLMIRPDKTMKVNRTAVEILEGLYNRDGRRSGEVLNALAPRLGVDRPRLLSDTLRLVEAVGAILNEDYTPRPGLRFGPFDRGMVAYPTLAEIALTYGCQNRCLFCYSGSPSRDGDPRPMTVGEIRRVMEKIFHEAHVPSLSFTGGEPTLHPHLPELIRHGKEVGFRVNLITNGLRAADPEHASRLVEAGLDSAQVSLEAGDPTLHDEIVARPGAHELTVAGIRNFRRLGIHVHTNSTLCSKNLEAAPDLIRFVARDLGLKTLSMNMVIPSGEALRGGRIGVTYTEVAGRLPGLLETAKEEGIRLVWYSPLPYCLLNPVPLGMGAKSCACVDGILSVDPSGRVLPCSSFEDGIGSLLEQPFERIYRSRAAAYWRKRKFVPPPCRECPDADLCAGACPLYWDAAGSFDELPGPGAKDGKSRRKWERRRAKSGTFGVRPRAAART